MMERDAQNAEANEKLYQDWLTLSLIHISQIGQTLSDEKVLIPSAYEERYHPESARHHSYHDPYRWNTTTLTYILDRQEYQMCIRDRVDTLLRLCPDDEDTIYQIVDLLVDTCATNRDRKSVV